MRRILGLIFVCASLLFAEVVDIPTRNGVTQRLFFMPKADAKAVLVLYAGGHGGLQIQNDGSFAWGGGNFLVRARELFFNEGFMVVIIDAPSDRQREPYLSGFRQTKEHVEDTKAVVAWIKERTNAPIWLVGTSRGTQSVGYVAPFVAESIRGIVLTSSILSDSKGTAVPYLPLNTLKLPVLVVHHENDGCMHCYQNLIPSLMEKLATNPSKELMMVSGGESKGDPCLAYAYHGYNGIENEVVTKMAQWIKAH